KSHNVQATNCNNIGFDDGTTTGWTISGAGPTNGSSFGTGAPTAGSSYITSGAGLDPFGNFPVVFSGAHSLQLSDNNTSTTNFLSTASRVIAVAPTGNTFFTLDFAIDILDFPHTQNDCARFTVAFYDASGTELSCPQYECYYYVDGSNNGVAVGVNSFQQTAGSPGYNVGNQYYPVTYSPWQSVAMDLTPYAGTNVTCVVSCSWCLYNYDWAYCYIDADCPTSNTTSNPTCGALPFELKGPTGFTSYSWTAPAGNNPATSTADSINANVAGTYSLSCTLNNCSTPATYTYTYVVETSPKASFTDVAGSACSGNFSFTSTSTPNGGTAITGYTWEWGDGTPNGTTATATHTFASGSIDTVTLVVTNGTCTDSIKEPISVSVPIVPVATATPATCYGYNGSITTAGTSGGKPGYTYLWSNSATSSSISAIAGSYTVTITDANNCTATATATITQPNQL
ncbi:MAG TPA: PKD domain-containing protein, partial [Bacteroidia bacterium]|nr:PKD domain-containing protein [Bacteroidia bacterium]